MQLKGAEPKHSFVLTCCNDTRYHSIVLRYNCGGMLGCLCHSAATLALDTTASKLLPTSASSSEPALCFSAKPVANHRLAKIVCHKLSWVAGARRLSLLACVSSLKQLPYPYKT